MSLRDFEAFLATPGAKTDAQVVAAMNANGVTAADVARIVGAPVADVAARVGAVQEANFLDFLMAPSLTDAQIVAEMNKLGITPERGSVITGVPLPEVQSRYAAVISQPVVQPPVVQPPVVRPPVVQTPPVVLPPVVQTPPVVRPPVVQTPPVVRPPVVQTPPVARTNEDIFRAFLMTPGLTDAQITAEMGRLGITNRQGSNITGVPITEVENRINALSSTMPFANATQGFTQDFNNYTSIAPGAQFAGGQSPYSQIMAQMRPVGNPYATARAGLPMGGYDPGIYDPNLLSNFVRQRAAELKAAGLPVPLGMDGGDGPGGVGDGASSGSGDAAGDAAAAAADAAAAASGEGTGPGTGAGWYMGGLIDRVSGANPSGPDDGQINVQVGEYVVKKSSVNKYGKGLLDMINEGKIPAKKIKSLLD